MNLIEVKVNGFHLVLSINLILLFVFFSVVVVFWVIARKRKKPIPIKLKECTLTVGGVSTTIECDYTDREIAYQSWVEMNTRKIGIPLDENNDVIVEVYNSWYKFFDIIRNNLKNIPGHKLDSSSQLIEKLTEILNSSLRAHLTKWQAKFRRWYDIEIQKEDNISLPPQEIQKKYAYFGEIIKEMKDVIAKMIVLKDELRTIAFNDKQNKDNS